MRLELGTGVTVVREKSDKLTTERGWWLRVNHLLNGGWNVHDFPGGHYLAQGRARLTRPDIRPLADEWATGRVVLERT